MDAAIPALTDVVLAIDSCYRERRILATLILLYSVMDVMGSLEASNGKASKNSFIAWVDQYVIPAGSLPCTALELYGARCGVLHTLSAESHLTRKRGTRRVLYAWGTASVQDLARTTNVLGSTDVAIHITDLISGFRQGLADYLEEVGREQFRHTVVTAAVNGWLGHMPTSLVSDFLRVVDGLGGPE